MFSRFERKIAFRYLRSKRSERFISVIAGFSFIGIALGVATLIVVMAVMNGFRAEITNKILGLNGHITISNYADKIYDFDNFISSIGDIEGISAINPVIDGQVMATTKYSSTGAMVKAIRLTDISNRPLIKDNIKAGSLLDFHGKNNLLIGSKLAERLGISAGDTLTLISSQGRSTALGTMPKLKKFTVSSIFEAGMYEYDNNVIFMPLEAAQIFFKYPESVSAIEIFTDDAHNSFMIANQLYEKLHGLYFAQDWTQRNASLFNALKIERTVMFLILTLIVFIAAFNIISSLIMLVNDKSKDIAILRTMGATKGSIIRIFFLCGAAIGVVGTFLGFIIGITFVLNIETIRVWLESLVGSKLFDPVIYFLSELPTEIRTEDVLWSVGMGLFFSFLATAYPAFKASKQDPAEALRYE
jgi:lipoprotein-releasing system permease protein